MAADIFLPFNYKPISSSQNAAGASYTPPAGYYSRVVVTISFHHQLDITAGSFSANALFITANGKAHALEFWLGPSDTISFSKSTDTAVVTAGAGSLVYAMADSKPSVSILINGAACCTLKDNALITGSATGTGGTGGTLTLTSDAVIAYNAEQYGIPT